jgi:long-chain acyl-CoA synthetase
VLTQGGCTLDKREATRAVLTTDPHFQLEERVIRGIPWRVYRNAVPSLRSVFEASARFDERDFLVYESERWRYADHRRIVTGLARRWHDQGVRKGDRIGIAMRNYPEWAMTFWATEVLGAIAVPLNAWWTGPELAYAIHDSGTSYLVADGERIAALARELPGLGCAEVIAVRARQTLPPQVIAWEAVLSGLDPDAVLPEVDIDPDDDATIMYTSGTTGKPKGAIATHRNHATNLRNTELGGAVAMKMAGITQPSAGPQTASGPQASSLQTFPFFHIGGLSGLYISTAMGTKVSLMYKWDTAEAVELMQKEQVNSGAMVPTLLRRLLDYAEERHIEFPSLGAMASGGAPVPPDLIQRIGQDFDRRVSPGNGYGLTETTSAVVVNTGEEYFRHTDSVGRAVPVADLRIVDPESGDDLATGAVGELWFRGPNVVRGYWNKAAETAEAFTDGWFHTGDLGCVDGDGLVYVVDRLKDVIIRSGENVYGAEVEAILFEHPAVADVAVIGLPHESWGEEVVAIVERQPGARVEAGDLQEHVGSRVARFKVPTQIIFTAEPLPRTATGKVLKRDLRSRLLDTAQT